MTDLSADPPRRRGALGLLLRRPLAVLGLVLIAIVIGAALAAPWLATYPPDQQNFDGLTLEGAP